MLKVIDCVLDYLFVPKCAGCGTKMDTRGTGLCKKCMIAYEDEQAEYCDFCGMEAHICGCIPLNMRVNGCIEYRKLIFYKSSSSDSPMHRMIYNVKRRYNTALIEFFAKELYNADIDNVFENAIVTYAPRSKEAVKKYGYDQSKLLAKFYAKAGNYCCKTLIRNKVGFKRNQQKLLNYKQRAGNIRGAFVLKNKKSIKDKTVILFDDVVTSGATLGECISLLYEAGAKSVICRSIAHTYKKNKHKND